jgi:heme-degrading monooxygenase HmoA
MYLVVSKWKIAPGKEAEADERGSRVQQALTKMPGIELVKSFRNEAGEVVAVMGYSSQDSYNTLMRERGPIETAITAEGLQHVAEWVSSERGDALHE